MNVPPLVKHAVEQHQYPLVFATISGAHLYGFASADSDYDLRGVHVLPIDSLIGLEDGNETVERTCKQDGVELDLVTHDIKKFMLLMLKPNGYVLEQLYSPLVVKTSSIHAELKTHAQSCITKNHSHHYLGFAQNQWRLFEKQSPKRVKPLLYVYRVLLSGIFLMRTGRIEANLPKLNEMFNLPYIPELIARKTTSSEKQTLTDADLAFHNAEFLRLRDQLEEESVRSQLPDAPTGKQALDDLLKRIRLAVATAAIVVSSLALVYCQRPALSADMNIARTVKTLGADRENISDALDSLATEPQQSVRLLALELHPIPRKTYFENTKTKDSQHVISCLRALHYLTGVTFSATSTAKLSDDERQFLDFRNEMHDDNPGHALHFFGVWMFRNADIVAPSDAQRKIIKQWKHWLTENESSFKPHPSGKAAQSMDEWYWFG